MQEKCHHGNVALCLMSFLPLAVIHAIFRVSYLLAPGSSLLSLSSRLPSSRLSTNLTSAACPERGQWVTFVTTLAVHHRHSDRHSDRHSPVTAVTAPSQKTL